MVYKGVAQSVEHFQGRRDRFKSCTGLHALLECGLIHLLCRRGFQFDPEHPVRILIKRLLQQHKNLAYGKESLVFNF